MAALVATLSEFAIANLARAGRAVIAASASLPGAATGDLAWHRAVVESRLRPDSNRGNHRRRGGMRRNGSSDSIETCADGKRETMIDFDRCLKAVPLPALAKRD